MESQNLSNMSWALATLVLSNKPLMESISSSAIARCEEFVKEPHGIHKTYEYTTNLLALSWSLAMSMQMTTDVADALRHQVVSLGYEVDRLVALEIVPEDDDVEEGIDVRLPGVPFARVNLPGIMVIFKPENWEVNRGDPSIHRPQVEWRLLSDWTAAALPRSRFPLAHSSEFDFGFVHRLDVPSSGLIMSAKSFAGLALLRFQLDTYELGREYIVLVINPFEPDLTVIEERLSKDNINMRSFVNPAGAPARTRIKNCSYAWPHVDPDVLTTLIAVKIHTGRHHQIRAHVTHFQHPTVADGKYSLREVTLRDDYMYGDMMWFENFFGRPVVPYFHESGPKRKTELKPAAGAVHGSPAFKFPWTLAREVSQARTDTDLCD